MFCKHCGSKIDDDAAFCPACGKPQGAAVAAAQGGGESYFDGGVFQWLGWKILGWLVTGFTFGICYPFAVNWMFSWEARHTVIDGRRLKFTGSAGGLFGTWIVCLLLTFVTLGIYYFWVPLKIRKWREANTFFEDEIPTFDAEQRLRRTNASRFDGGLMQYIGWNILGWLVTFFTLGICYPWAVQMVYSWEQRHKVYCKRRCTFDGQAVGLFGTWMLCLLLCLVTFGIYCFWVPLRIHRWKVRHTHLLADSTPVEEQKSKELTPEELAEKERRKEELMARLSVAGPVLTVAGTVMQILYFRCHSFSWSFLQYRPPLPLYWPLCLLPLCAVGLLALSRVKIKNRSVVQLILITAALLFASLVADIVYHMVKASAVVITVSQLLSFAGVAMSFAGWYKGLATEELTERQRKERAAARLSVAGSVLTVVGAVRQILYRKVFEGDRWSDFFQSYWPLCPLLLCAVGLLVLSRVRFKNRSVVQLGLITAALLFASLALMTVGTLLSLAGVAVSFAGWYKGLATEELTERQRKERAAAWLSVAGSVLTVAGTVRQILYFNVFRRYGWSYFFQSNWPLCPLLLCAVGLLVLRRVKIKNRSVVQLILMIAAPLFLLLFLRYTVSILRGFALSLEGAFRSAYYVRYDVFLLLNILFQLLPFAGVAVSFAGWLKERRAAAEVAGDAAGE